MKKLLLLLMLSGLPICMSAEGERPNALIIHQTDGTEWAYPLKGTTVAVLPVINAVKVVTSDGLASLPLSTINRFSYEYRNESTLSICGIEDDSERGTDIYSMDGRKVTSVSGSLEDELRRLPHGVYIVKNRNTTFKVAK